MRLGTHQRINPDSLSDFVIYADESGDHGLRNIDPNYPLFVLAFIIMRREDYISKVTPDLQRLKFKYWGHDQVVFHERDIRKKVGPFAILADKDTHNDFMSDLTQLMTNAPFHICAFAFDKSTASTAIREPWNPYTIALHICMEHLCRFLVRNDQKGKLAHVIFESRGNKEDDELELFFRRIADNKASIWRRINFKEVGFEPVFARKDANAAGLQIADLIARPFGMKFLHPEQLNRTYNVLGPKLINVVDGKYVHP